MSTPICYQELLRRHSRIQIPMIQRDYAQGRPAEAEVRNEFLRTLKSALELPRDDDSLPRNLDFIYGSVEGTEETRFSPLDGQQRLTTLYLLHWYLAWNDGSWALFQQLFREGEHSRFSYSVRPSSNEFFDALVAFEPKCRPQEVTSITELIKNEAWYFRNWRLDPTIQSVLTMLDAIHDRFAGTQGLFARLIDEEHPAITFQLLDLENFGLSDDLYIKMNARGKPLTPFETFKARYEQCLKAQFGGQTRDIGGQPFPIAEFVARRLDTTWADLFWAQRDRKTNSYDEILMNVFQTVALISRNPESSDYLEQIEPLQNKFSRPTYSTYDVNGLLDEPFTEILISLLETWSQAKGFTDTLLPDNRYFDERKIFATLVENPTNLTNTETLMFAGYALFIREHESAIDKDEFQEWMRVIHNLAVNSYIERNEELRSASRGLRELLPNSSRILEHLADLSTVTKVSGFLGQQMKEERLKAQLIENHDGWRDLIDRAEGHGYFSGQIGFLLEFADVAEELESHDVAAWNDEIHDDLKDTFEDYLSKAEQMFTPHGLANPGQSLWQRALLVFGNYLLKVRSNWAFPFDGASGRYSWKRLLRGAVEFGDEKRPIVKDLWDRLDGNLPIVPQLSQIIEDASGLDHWRDALARSPQAISYCGHQALRFDPDIDNRIYLLRKSQMNGQHAELFTYCFQCNQLRTLHRQGGLAPMQLQDYQEVKVSDEEPYIWLTFQAGSEEASVCVHFNKDHFDIFIELEYLIDAPDVESALCEAGGFVKQDKALVKGSAPEAIANTLIELAQLLGRFSQDDSTDD